MMKVVAFLVAMTAAWGLASTARAQDEAAGTGEIVAISNRDRVWANYTREAATVGAGALRVELRGFHAEDTSNPELDIIGFPIERIENREDADVTSTTGNLIDILASFGIGDNAEVGFDIPILLTDYELLDQPGLNRSNIGDFSMYGKFKYKVAENCRVAGGLEVSTPTGPEQKYMGTGDLGTNPFISTRYEYQRLAVGGHLGYFFYTGNTKNVLNYSGNILLRAASTVTLRAEISGRHFKQFGDDFNDVLVYPGVDLDFFDWITVRPTGMANITGESMDWGVGVGIATRFTLF